MKAILFAAAVLAVSSLTAQASPIYDSVVTGGTPTTVGTSTFAESFTTGTGALNDIAIALTKSTSSNTGSIIITLWSDNGNGLSSPATDAPGTQITGSVFGTLSYATVLASSLTSGVKTIDFFSPTTSLTPNTEYWIEIAKGSGPSSTIQFYLNSSVPTIGGTFSGKAEVYDSAGVSSGSPPEMELCISGDGSCSTTLAAAAAPEPSAMSILGFGIAAIGFGVHRRRWSRASASSAD